jgi:hypothetical protein
VPVTARALRFREHFLKAAHHAAEEPLRRFGAFLMRLVRHLAVELVTVDADGHQIDVHQINLR